MPPVLPLVASHLTGPHLALDPLTETDAAELGVILQAPEVYAHGYVMHHRPTSDNDAAEFALQRFVHAPPPNGVGYGRTPYAIRLGVDVKALPAGTTAETTSLRSSAQMSETLFSSPKSAAERRLKDNSTAWGKRSARALSLNTAKERGGPAMELLESRMALKPPALLARRSATRSPRR